MTDRKVRYTHIVQIKNKADGKYGTWKDIQEFDTQDKAWRWADKEAALSSGVEFRVATEMKELGDWESDNGD